MIDLETGCELFSELAIAELNVKILELLKKWSIILGLQRR
jgi:hypothetical protein